MQIPGAPTRDSNLWNALLTFGMAVSGALIVANDPASYGLSPVAFKIIQLVALGITAVGGKNANSLQSRPGE
jgi:hypothetical protein